MLQADAPTIQKAVPVEVVAEVGAARGCLTRAMFKLDDGGFGCLALNDLVDDANTLLAEWAGRCRPRIEREPAWIAAAAVEWRRERDRRLRR